MSYHGQAVIDSDSHINQFWDLDRSYQPYMDPEYRETFARFSAAAHARIRFPGDSPFRDFLWPMPPAHPMGVYDVYENPKVGPAAADGRATQPGSRPQTQRAGGDIDPTSNWDPKVRLADMDKAEIDISVIFPYHSDSFCAINDFGFEAALHRAYHRFIAEYCDEARGRLRWIGVSTMRDIPESVAQLEYWAKKDPNFAGSFIARSCPDGTGLDNPNLHPLFAASQDLDLPIWVHAGNGRPPWTPWPTAPNTLYHTVGGMFALTHLIGGGIFDRFPNLRIGLFSSYGGWLPYTVAKLDEVWASGSAQTPFLKRSPSEIIASGQVFLSIEPDEPQLEHAVEDLGEHLWLFGTNYPLSRRFWSGPGGLPMITQRPGLAESAKVKILGENAVRFLPRLSA